MAPLARAEIRTFLARRGRWAISCAVSRRKRNGSPQTPWLLTLAARWRPEQCRGDNGIRWGPQLPPLSLALLLLLLLLLLLV